MHDTIRLSIVVMTLKVRARYPSDTGMESFHVVYPPGWEREDEAEKEHIGGPAI